MTDEAHLINAAKELGAASAAVIAVDAIAFRPEFRGMCEMNTCGKYGRCWMCPPDVGAIEPLIGQAKSRQRALVFQTIGQLEDSFDIEGMTAAAQNHNRVTQAVANALAPRLERPLVLGAGACQVCNVCTRTTGEPCAHPGRAIPSMEAFGVAVSEMAPLCGMHYINGPNTVTYFGAILYGESAAQSGEVSHANH